ncbi:glutamine synthetase [Tistlia consotensis]|uniref:Glutamine synthetase n=1 Tax=Tistlia consotensis USBA 355 TaxID=560819 RepID=A0A1Y6BYC6_9PROT|nr:glutamine synthetase [Tistlia consotensis]SMF36115.1 glutamine synthetase [Tistlia consotensis USBA 355]SNR71451.1 glutamine synthetase [Tistlia consotensis]
MNDPVRVAELKKQLIAEGVRYCFAAYVDVHGVPKSKTVPVEKFDKMAMGSELYTVGALEGMGLIGPEKDECAAVPDLDSLIVLPWDKRYAWFAADLHYHGAPYPNCSRTILKRQLARAAEAGYRFNLGIEPEFYVLRPPSATQGGGGRPEQLQASRFLGPCPGYDVHQTWQSMDFLDPIVGYMNQLGWGVYSFDAEGGNGQYELDFAFADALTMADRMVFLRFMLRSHAETLGAVATFMPKPFADDFRSGAHFNMSLADPEAGTNLFDRALVGSGDFAARYGIGFPDLGYHFVAGLLEHAGALAAVTCPTHNSYKGLVAQGDMPDMSWAPVLRCYGNNNRSAMLRLPMNRPCIENRAPDISCNIHLGAALSLAAGLDGIERRLDPGVPLNDNLYQRLGKPSARGRIDAGNGLSISRLPRTLLEALEHFEEDPLVVEAFGEEFRDIYLAQKLKEWDHGFYAVSAEERARQLTFI